MTDPKARRRAPVLPIIAVAAATVLAALTPGIAAPAPRPGRPSDAASRPVATSHRVAPPTTTTSTTTTTTTTAPPPPTPPPAPAQTAAASAPTPGWGCGPALAYLRAHAAPGFQLVCPGYAQGAQALTCFSYAPCVPGERMIVIADACPAAYMNEAHNSWVLLHQALGTAIPDANAAIDPFGHC
jgi:hypothetical protein